MDTEAPLLWKDILTSKHGLVPCTRKNCKTGLSFTFNATRLCRAHCVQSVLGQTWTGESSAITLQFLYYCVCCWHLPSVDSRTTSVMAINENMIVTAWNNTITTWLQKKENDNAWKNLIGRKKIWKVSPWRGWQCPWRFSPPSAARCSSLFATFSPFSLLSF